MSDELLYEELKREGYKDCVEWCIKNWDKLSFYNKQLLLSVGISPTNKELTKN